MAAWPCNAACMGTGMLQLEKAAFAAGGCWGFIIGVALYCVNNTAAAGSLVDRAVSTRRS